MVLPGSEVVSMPDLYLNWVSFFNCEVKKVELLTRPVPFSNPIADAALFYNKYT